MVSPAGGFVNNLLYHCLIENLRGPLSRTACFKHTLCEDKVSFFVLFYFTDGLDTHTHTNTHMYIYLNMIVAAE